MSKKKTEEEKKNEAWMKELKELEKHALYTGDGIFLCSDGTEVNFKGTARNIRVRMMELSDEETEEVLALSSEYQSIKGKIVMLKRRIGGGSLYQKNAGWQKCLKRTQEMLDLFGKMYSGTEVHKIIVTEWGHKDVRYETVLKFQRENKDTIATLRDEYQSDYKNIRLVHKRSRLDELTDLYSSRKQKYAETQTKSDYELMLKTLEQIRKEVEGQQIHINGAIKVEHELAVQNHVNDEIMKYLNINDIIVGRLCARLKVNPKYIMYRLHTSYYSKFSGFLPDELDDSNEIMYPSEVVYDFNRIAGLNDALNVTDIEYKEEPTISKPKEIGSLRDKLKAKLKEKKKATLAQRANINKIEGK